MIYQFKDLDFDFHFYIMVVDDAGELLKFDRENSDFHLSEQLNEVNTADGVVFSNIVDKNDKKSIVVCFKPKFINGNYLYFLRLVAHETIHITFRRFEGVELLDQLQNNQIFANYYDWIYTHILNVLLDYRAAK